jgi:hypothetical protein
MWGWSNSDDALEPWNEVWSFPCLCLCHKSQCTLVLHYMGPMCCWLSDTYTAVGMLFLFDMLLLNGSCDANKQVPWRYIQPIRLAQHTVGNDGQLFLGSGLKSQIAGGPEVAVQFLIVTEVVEGWLLWFISWYTVMV